MEVTAILSNGSTVGLVVAAGIGERLAAGDAKGFVVLAGEPLLVHAVRALGSCAAITEVVLVVGAGLLERAADALGDAGLGSLTVVEGGATRQESVRSGLAACPPDTEVVAVHDAARPLVTADLVTRTVEALVDPWAAVAPALPVVDTVKTLVNGTVGTVDRRGLWVVQTPQVFALRTLRGLHERLDGAVTDDLVLVERDGGAVRLIEGDRRNFKITYPEDLAMAEALLAVGHGR